MPERQRELHFFSIYFSFFLFTGFSCVFGKKRSGRQKKRSGRTHTRSRINKLYFLAYLHTMALSFFISLFVTYTDIAYRQTTNIFFGFLGIHSSDAREKKKKRKKNFCRVLQNFHTLLFCVFAYPLHSPFGKFFKISVAWGGFQAPGGSPWGSHGTRRRSGGAKFFIFLCFFKVSVAWGRLESPKNI